MRPHRETIAYTAKCGRTSETRKFVTSGERKYARVWQLGETPSTPMQLGETPSTPYHANHHANHADVRANPAKAAITLAIWPRIIDGALRKSDVLRIQIFISDPNPKLHLGSHL